MLKVLTILILSGTLGLQENISKQNLKNNPGLIPLKLGTAKVETHAYSLIRYYDLNPIIVEVNKLKFHSKNVRTLVGSHKDYSWDTSNYLKILEFSEKEVTDKLNNILPHPLRTKRGLINGIGSIFKSITGNLDSNDGEKYDRLIKELQDNQNNLVTNIKKQNSLSISLIDQFNSTVQQVKHNERLLESKINQIAKIVENQTYKENSMFIKDILNQIINTFEIINSILQDVENSIQFSRLNILHPSIIKTKDLFKELQKLNKIVEKDQLPIEISFENTLLYEKIISLKSYISNFRITYILHIPITHPSNFDYYHLFSIPILTKGQFKAVIPQNKYLTKNEKLYAFLSDPCLEISHRTYICPSTNIRELTEDNPCEIQLLNVQNTSTCKQTVIHLSRPAIRQLDNSNKWVVLLPAQQTTKLKCQNQNEIENLLPGSYLFDIPIGCQLSCGNQIITNDHQVTNSEPIILPDLEEGKPEPPKSIGIQLDDLNLDELHSIKTAIMENEPIISFKDVAHIPSFWTMFIYLVLVSICLYLVHKKIGFRGCKTNGPSEPSQDIEMSRVQLPR
ncbi:uncharacterized protein [Leptinotarsa decemlineata]|uniref:uncharacterized protein n=1 Tax=Leptinotarsa decemlineata TaxID=7539 RepID=UPI003D306AE6